MSFKTYRLTRSVRDLGELVDLFGKHALALVSLSESFDATTAAGRAFLNLLGTFAQWEREAIGERITGAFRHKRDHLEVYGPVPYGFKRSGSRLVPEGRELEVVRQVHALRRRDGTLAAIAGALDKRGTRTRRGRK